MAAHQSITRELSTKLAAGVESLTAALDELVNADPVLDQQTAVLLQVFEKRISSAVTSARYQGVSYEDDVPSDSNSEDEKFAQQAEIFSVIALLQMAGEQAEGLWRDGVDDSGSAHRATVAIGAALSRLEKMTEAF